MPLLFRIKFKCFSRFLMGTTFTHKLLLEGWDRIRFGLKPHSEWCTLIVAYGF